MDQGTDGQERGDPELGIGGQQRVDVASEAAEPVVGDPESWEAGDPEGNGAFEPDDAVDERNEANRGGSDESVPEPQTSGPASMESVQAESAASPPVSGEPVSDDSVSGDSVPDDSEPGESASGNSASGDSARDESASGGRILDDITAISRLKFRYLRTLDTKSWDEFADTMIPEATATYSDYLQFESREAFLMFMRNTLGPHVITEHRCEHPEIDVYGDTATGIWYLADTVLIPGHNMMLRGAAYYSDRYVRCDDGRWRISHTGYERTYEVVLSLSDLPSLRLTSNKWGSFAEEDGTFSSVEHDPGVAPIEDEPEAG